jgi:hypothetical protein
MENTTVRTDFVIRSHSWKRTNQDFKSDFSSLLKTDLKKAECFCDAYFDEFFLLHKIGHIILHKYDELHHVNQAYTEHCANLFAYKYLEYKKEHEYLQTLTQCINSLRISYNSIFDFDIEKMNRLYSTYKKDIVTLAAFHFNSFMSCITCLDDFSVVIERISKGRLIKINNGIILRKGIRGIDLINECVSTVFEMNDDVPEISLKYCEDLSVDNFTLLLE